MTSGHSPSARAEDREPVNRRRAARVLIGVLLLVASLAGIKPGLAAWARWMALRQLRVGAISEAQRWLDRAEWFGSHLFETELMRAVCFRNLGQMERWQECVKRAREAGGPSARTQHEWTLGLVR
ncbi:MAG TPA: hypothetical protein EYP14_03075, partial [Planctomycetaceae bacterium]|nr:hypothetical protein [Planctomycetaceae bacterium]